MGFSVRMTWSMEEVSCFAFQRQRLCSCWKRSVSACTPCSPIEFLDKSRHRSWIICWEFITASSPAEVIRFPRKPRYVKTPSTGTKAVKPSSPRLQFASSRDSREKLSGSLWAIHTIISEHPVGPKSLLDKSRDFKLGDKETKFRNGSRDFAVRPQLARDSCTRPMLKHSEMAARPMSPMGLLLKRITSSSCVSAEPWSKNSSIVEWSKPMSSISTVRTRLSWMAAPSCLAPSRSMLFPDNLTSAKVLQDLMSCPKASQAAAELTPL
mmetsp:Transcript_42734/g.120769  ORF Transcript_42734/g.120769 Transcript_42734/m.120769 type:complete len:267 (-) Transcript_42734:62-862(-)